MLRQSFLWVLLLIAVFVPTLVSAIDCDQKTSTFQFFHNRDLDGRFTPGSWDSQNCSSRVFHAVCETIKKIPDSERNKERLLRDLMSSFSSVMTGARVKRYCAELPPSGDPTPEFDDDFDLGDL